jgi:hypothetical protein
MPDNHFTNKSVNALIDNEDLKEVCETLHKEAGIDYNRLAILRYRRHSLNSPLTLALCSNPSVAVLYEEALKYEEGSAITSSGALVTSSGAKTGRSPRDKRIVDDPSYAEDVWWGTSCLYYLWPCCIACFICHKTYS